MRQRLRHDLTRVHGRLDTAFSAFDLHSKPDYIRFLSAHRLAFAAIRPARDALTDQHLLDRMIGAIDDDLDTLGNRGPAVSLRPRVVAQPLAQDYVLLGSRLGTQVLHRRWLAATDRGIRRAGSYLSLPPMQLEWRAFCNRAMAMGAEGRTADAVLAEAEALFVLFLEAGHVMAGVDAANVQPLSTQLEDHRIA